MQEWTAVLCMCLRPQEYTIRGVRRLDAQRHHLNTSHQQNQLELQLVVLFKSEAIHDAMELTCTATHDADDRRGYASSS